MVMQILLFSVFFISQKNIFYIFTMFVRNNFLSSMKDQSQLYRSVEYFLFVLSFLFVLCKFEIYSKLKTKKKFCKNIANKWSLNLIKFFFHYFLIEIQERIFTLNICIYSLNVNNIFSISKIYNKIECLYLSIYWFQTLIVF